MELNVCFDENGFFITPGDGVDDKAAEECRFARKNGKYYMRLSALRNYKIDGRDATKEDVKDIAEICGILAYVFEKDGLRKVLPAFGESGTAMDAMCCSIGTCGAWGDYVHINCRCGNKWYFNQRNIPEGRKYEVQCGRCGTILMRKKVTRQNQTPTSLS